MTTDRTVVLDSTDCNYVLPAPPRGHGFLVTGEGAAKQFVMQTGAVARALGQRFHTQAESMELLLVELRERLEQLHVCIAEDARAQLKGAVREIVRVVDWCDAVQSELVNEANKASAGLEPVDLLELCEQQAGAWQASADPIVVLAKQPVIYWGDRSQLAHLVQKALALVWARTGERGLRCLEVSSQHGVACLRVCSRGEPVSEVDGDVIDLFRVAADNLGAVVVPDELGPGGAGLVLRLPE